ncbi:MAG TPA: sensor histidine kinase [Spirochaetota bacterium]|nr:sensor histidine kinase [Spirochaetota bacterium]HPJ34351.1 sensor histidine kinase [Spirochaetota bacterium]
MENCGKICAEVKLRNNNSIVRIPVTDDSKPSIPEPVKERWQKIIDITARHMNVPAALIMEIHESDISVFISSHTSNNPYMAGATEELQGGLYCETVLGRDTPLYIADAMNSSCWRDNPDIKFGMKSYLGYPVKWPDGEFYGTICVLDTIENPCMESFHELMILMREVIERDLEQIQFQWERDDSGYSTLLEKIEKLRIEKAALVKSDNCIKDVIDGIYGSVIEGLSIISTKTESMISGNNDNIPPGGLKDLKARIDNLSSVIELIYKSSNSSGIEISSFVREMTENLKKRYPEECSNVCFGIDIPESIVFEGEVGFACISVIFEAVLNSIRHAFDNKINGEIYIFIRENRPGEYILHISDNGKGMGPEEKVEEAGMGIIKRLIELINGVVYIKCDRGTSYFIDFKTTADSCPAGRFRGE